MSNQRFGEMERDPTRRERERRERDFEHGREYDHDPSRYRRDEFLDEDDERSEFAGRRSGAEESGRRGRGFYEEPGRRFGPRRAYEEGRRAAERWRSDERGLEGPGRSFDEAGFEHESGSRFRGERWRQGDDSSRFGGTESRGRYEPGR
jgi:hypothetical protein